MSIDEVQEAKTLKKQKPRSAASKVDKTKTFLEEEKNQDPDLFTHPKEMDKVRIEDDLKGLHMFSTSTNMKKIQVAL